MRLFETVAMPTASSRVRDLCQGVHLGMSPHTKHTSHHNLRTRAVGERAVQFGPVWPAQTDVVGLGDCSGISSLARNSDVRNGILSLSTYGKDTKKSETSEEAYIVASAVFRTSSKRHQPQTRVHCRKDSKRFWLPLHPP